MTRRLIQFCMIAISLLPALRGQEILLNGAVPYVIFVSQEASSVDRTAAKELQHYLALVGGCEFPIVGRVPEGYRGIYVGNSDEAKELLPELKETQFQRDEIYMRTVDGNLVLAGDVPRGTLYAVYSFLEDYVGVRWWTSQAEFVPPVRELRIPAPSCRYAPPFFSREAYYWDITSHPVFAARMKNNGQFEELSEEFGGHIPILGWCHTFWRLLPSDKYFDPHPEWFSLVDGKRIPGGPGKGQLCLTNLEMRRELVANARQWLREHPGCQILSVSQNDVMGDACECPKCSELAEREHQSGVLVDFVNYVAEELEKDFPGLLVETLAYYHTLEPPVNIRPRRNVLIRVAPITSDFGRPLDGRGEGNSNAAFAEMLTEWSKISSQVAVWNYVSNFANDLLPFPNFRNIGNDLRFFAANNVKVVFEQGGPSENLLSNFSAMRAWVISKLLWNPELDQEALMREFAAGYYGTAAEKVLAVFKMIHEEQERNGNILRCSQHGSALPIDKIRKGQDLLEEAMRQVADEPELARRVRIVKSHFDFAWLDSLSPLGLSAEDRENGERLLVELRELVEEHHATFYGESYDMAKYLERLEKNLERLTDFKTDAIPQFCQGLPDDQWYEYGAESFRLTIPGDLTDIVEVPEAASGKVGRLYSTKNWLLQLQLPRGTWRIMVAMRMAAKGNANASAAVAEIGFYNEAMGQIEHQRDIDIANFQGRHFQWFDFGEVSLLAGYLYIACLGNPNLDFIDVERIILLCQ